MLTTTQFHSLCVFAMLFLSPFDGAMLRAQFTDVTDDYGLAIYHDIPISESGVSFHDFNRDGLDDLTYAGSGMGVYTFRNTGSGFVQENYFAGIAGKTLHPIWVDYDNDGDADFFATRALSCPVLFRNNGDMTFEDVSDALPCPMDAVISTTATWGDYNSDGFLDVYVANYNQQPTMGAPNWLFRNNGDGTFDEVAEEAGVSYGNFPAYQCMFIDGDFDHDTDLLVVNDKADGCMYYRNDGGVFTDIANENGFNVHIDAMSLSVSDVDHDGDYDYYISNTVEGNVFLINENGTFVNRAAEWNATVNANCWGSVFIDTQMKSWEDLYVVSTGPQEGMNVLLQNAQGAQFNATQTALNNEDAEFIYAVAKGDANNDGAYDVMTMPYYADGSLLFQASGPSSTWAKVALQGTASNRDGVGATVHCYVNGNDYIRPVTSGENFTSQDSRYIMFGLNGAAVIDSVVVQWPSGITSVHTMLAAGLTHTLVEPAIAWVQQLEYTVSMCPGASASIDAGEWYAVEWEGGSTELQLEVFSEGVVSALAWNEQGQQFALQYQVVELETTNANWQIVPSVCGTDDAALEASEVVATAWLNNQAYSPGDAQLSPGNYEVSWTDILGCSYSTTVEVPFVEPMSLSAMVDTACFGEEAYYTLVVEAAMSPLVWLGVDEAQGFLDAGTYSVSVIDARGCMAETSFDIVQHAQPLFELDASTACYGELASATYEWTNAQLPITLLEEAFDWSALVPGQYELEWLDAAGCIVETEFIILENAEIHWEADITNASAAGNGLIELEIEGGLPPYDIVWSNGSSGNVLSLATTGSYSATITDAAGCCAVAENLFVPLGVGEENEVGDIVFDPLRGLHNQSSRVHSIRILDSAGRMVSEFTLAPGGTHATSELTKGMYFISFEGGVLRVALK
jgi:ASPIC and UnbV/FG-GAP-like repeat